MRPIRILIGLTFIFASMALAGAGCPERDDRSAPAFPERQPQQEQQQGPNYPQR
jgi:hypothetical protein